MGISHLEAQDTFDDKRHPDTQTAKSTATTTAKFNSQGLPIKKDKRTSSLTARTNFQMPSVFNLDKAASLYKHKVIGKGKNGIPLFIKSEAKPETAKLTNRQSIEAVCNDYLMDVSGLLQINDPSFEFKTISQKTDAQGLTHIKLHQSFKGVKVYGSEVVVHLNKRRQAEAINGGSRPTPQLESVSPKLSLAKSLVIVENDLGTTFPKNTSAEGGSALEVSPPEEELLIYTLDGLTYLARHLTVYPNIMDRWEYFIDANTGKILDKFYHTCTLHYDFNEDETHSDSSYSPPENGSGADLNRVNRQLNSFSTNGNNYLINTTKSMFNAGQSEMPDNPVGAIMTLDLRNEAPEEGVKVFHVTSNTTTWNNPTAVSAHYNADVSYDYFRNTFNRNSINGQGGTIISFINVADPDGGGGFDNAFWNGKAMFYGNGRLAFKPLAGGLDVGGHEMSHGVIGATANLEYRNQSGAINESFADIFGAMIDRDDWQLAEDIVETQYFPSGAMRDMQNPNNGGARLGDNGWQPKDMTEFYTGEQDNGGVHINSGIPNRAYYLVATDIGKDKAEQIYYQALDNYLTVSSQFIDLRLAVLRAAADIHGDGSAEVQAAQSAFDTVGITDGEGTDTENEIPTANGSDFILSLDIRTDDPNTLYISDTNGENFIPLTTTRVDRKPSIADDGSFAIYVTEDNTVNAVTLDPNNPEESVLSAETIWAAVALSKDGTKLAAVQNNQENIIYISDLVSGESQSFELYNPTSADGVRTGEVLYPDALEWDYSGQYLIYDALNKLENGNGEDIDYWDVGALRVWNNQSNSFGDGDIQKLFTNLPEGVSIGNPSFSKTSGNILAFDYLDALNDTYEVITANIETGEVKTVYQNNKLGFPNYSKTDGQLIFDSFNNGDEDVLAIGMAADKISPSGNASELIPNGKWGIWYTVGARSTLSSEKEITDFRFNVVAPAAVGVINGNQITVDLPNNINKENLVATFASSAKTSVSIAGTQQQSGITLNNFTNAVVYRVTAEDGSTKDFTVTIGTAGPVDPNDSDGDGVLNAQDQCPNTPPNATVDTNGCEIFSLPADNFRVLSKGESCKDSNNGSITISATANNNYTATISGNGANTSSNFTNGASFDDLEGGMYTICITVQGQAGYENCFDIIVVEPEDLSVSAKTDLTAKSVTLNLAGGSLYTININDEVFTTSESEITLPLKSEATKLMVKTDKECQGVYEEIIELSAKTIVYPNPISSGVITVQLSRPSQENIELQLNTFDGRTILQKTGPPGTKTVTLDADALQSGIYVLTINNNGTKETYKIIKR